MQPYSKCRFMSCPTTPLPHLPQQVHKSWFKAWILESYKPRFKSLLCDFVFSSFGKPHNLFLSQPHFSHLHNGDNSRNTHFTGYGEALGIVCQC